MFSSRNASRYLLRIMVFVTPLTAVASFAAEHVSGDVLGGGAPIAQSTVTLWEAGADAPKKLAEAKTNDRGQFEIRSTVSRGLTPFCILWRRGECRRLKTAAATTRQLYFSP